MMYQPGDDDDNDVGYRRPPTKVRYKKGESGNLAGRPRGRHREAPHEAVLGPMVTIREGGKERRVTAAEAFVLQCLKRGIAGDSSAAGACLTMIEEANSQQSPSGITTFIRVIVDPGSVTSALLPLRMATNLDPYRETARIVLKPWLVEAALARLPQPLSPADQRTVVKATRTPRKVRWPEWWTEHP